jgi:hypothetical protein
MEPVTRGGRVFSFDRPKRTEEIGMKTTSRNSVPPRVETEFDLDALLHPALAFENPMDVVRDADLTLNEKRAILASWASDACAIESIPVPRQTPHGRTVTFDEVIDALRCLDVEAEKACWRPQSAWRRRLRSPASRQRSGNGGRGLGLH